jgi:hypothetical protein
MRGMNKIFTLFCITLTFYCYSQQLHFQQLTTKDGLISNDVYSIRQDSKGYIWACTNYGIVKYNGTSFTSVCTNIPFNERFAYCLFEDEQGGMWFGNSRAHIFRIVNDSAQMLGGTELITAEMQKSVSEVNVIFRHGPEFIIGTKLHSYVSVNGSWKRLCDGFKNDSLDFLVLEKGGSYFPVMVNHTKPATDIIQFRMMDADGKKTEFRCKLPGKIYLAPRYVRSCDEKLYISNDRNLLIINEKQEAGIVPFDKPIVSLNCSQGSIWVGCYNDGLYRLDPEGKVLDHYFAGISVNAVLFDQQNGMWASTSGHGLYHCTSTGSSFYSNIPALASEITLLKVVDSVLFVGTTAGALYRIREKELLKLGLPPDVVLDVTDILKLDDGYVIATRSGLIVADPGLKRFRFEKPQSVNIPALGLQKISGNSYYFISRAGLGKIEDHRLMMNRLLEIKINTFCRLTETELLIGSNAGLYTFDTESGKMDLVNKSGDLFINELKWAGDKILVCTRGNGLFEIGPDLGLQARYDIPFPIINDIYRWNDDLVICSNTGVFQGRRNNWRQLYPEESGRVVVSGDRLFIGSNYGLIGFTLNSGLSGKIPFYLVRAASPDSVHTEKLLRFGAAERNLGFSFDHLDFSLAKRSLFYELKGALTQSGVTEGSTLHLSNLPYGSYQLKVLPVRHAGEAPVRSLSICFIVEPAFWETGWFRGLVIILSALFVAGITYLIYERVRREEKRKAEITRVLAEYKLKAIKAQINPHFISNALAAVQQLISRNEMDQAGLYLAKYSLLIRNVLRYSDRSIVRLSEELQLIELNIELEMLRFEKSFEFILHISPELDADLIFVPPLITQPFIENAIWHGLLPLKGLWKGILKIDVRCTGKDLVIAIEDNGVGRKSAEHGTEAKGTALIRSRLENINLLYGFKAARIEITDLKDPSGTLVRIILPYLQNHEEH